MTDLEDVASGELHRAADALRATRLPFGFCGSCGLEVFAAARGASLGRTSHDIDAAVRRDDIDAWATRLRGSLRIPTDGELREATVETIRRTNAHEVHVALDGLDLELLLNEVDGEDWVYRRDHRVRRLLRQAFLESSLPILAPEIVLLFKSKAPSDKDTADFNAIAPLLDDARRAWLQQALDVTNAPLWSNKLTHH